MFLAGGGGGGERGQETAALASDRNLARTRASRAAAVQAWVAQKGKWASGYGK